MGLWGGPSCWDGHTVKLSDIIFPCQFAHLFEVGQLDATIATGTDEETGRCDVSMYVSTLMTKLDAFQCFHQHLYQFGNGKSVVVLAFVDQYGLQCVSLVVLCDVELRAAAIMIGYQLHNAGMP